MSDATGTRDVQLSLRQELDREYRRGYENGQRDQKATDKTDLERRLRRKLVAEFDKQKAAIADAAHELLAVVDRYYGDD